MGDGIQAAKAGILEIGDVFVVNKADRDGADQVAPRAALDARAGRAGPRAPGGRRSCKTVALAGEGIDELVAAIDQHHALARVESGELRAAPHAPGRATRSRRSRSPRCASGGATCTGRVGLDGPGRRRWPAGELDPYAAADALLATRPERRRPDPATRRRGSRRASPASARPDLLGMCSTCAPTTGWRPR